MIKMGLCFFNGKDSVLIKCACLYITVVDNMMGLVYAPPSSRRSNWVGPLKCTTK